MKRTSSIDIARVLQLTLAPLAFGLAVATAAPGCAVQAEDPEAVGSADSAIIGSTNAKFFNLGSGGGLLSVSSGNWSQHWTHVVTLAASDGTPILFFYSRELGTAKIFRYNTSGGITLLASRDDLQTDWDMVVPARSPGQGFNLLFYRRSDGLLKAMDVRSNGGFATIFEQEIPDPTGLDSTHGWDNVVPAKITQRGDVVFYHRLTGKAQFWRYDPAEGQFAYPSQQTWQKTWDEIESGDIDGDSIDDLVFYNQDDGTLKLAPITSGYQLKSSSQVLSAGTSHGGRLMVADFGGGARKDVALYQVDGGTSFENGRLRIWTDNSDGTRSVTVNQAAINDGWTHLLPVNLGAAKSGILFYSNQHVINVKVYPMTYTNDDMPWSWKSGDAAQLTKLANAMRKTYAPAGLAFNVTFGALGHDDNLATYVCNESSQGSGNDWVEDHVPPNTLPITLAARGPGGPAGCSSLGADFVKSSYWMDNDVSGLYESYYGNYTEKHYAHEVGHYFGLAHGHVEDADTLALVLEELDDGDISTLDTDTDVSGNFHPVYDTPPALGAAYWKDRYGDAQGKLNMCEEGRIETFVNEDGETVNLTVHPHNVMAYNQCPGSLTEGGLPEGLARLTRDQIRAVRQALYDERKALIGLP